MRFGSNPIEGSNPSLSATPQIPIDIVWEGTYLLPRIPPARGTCGCAPTTLGLRADSKECPMPATRVLTTALAFVLIAAVPARATSVPTLTVIDSIRPGLNGSYALDTSSAGVLGDYLYFQAGDGTNGNELWRTNGTTTTLVEDIYPGSDNSSPYGLTALGDYLYFSAYDGTNNRELWRTDGAVTERVPFPIVGEQYHDCDCYETSIVAVGGRLFTTVYSDDTGNEFAYLDEPTYVLPETNRDASVWTTTLVILAGLTAAAGIALRVRGATRT